MRLVRWFKKNVLKNEELEYTVFFQHMRGSVKFVPISVKAKGKAEAVKKAKKYIRENAKPGSNYRFIKVLEDEKHPLRYKEGK